MRSTNDAIQDRSKMQSYLVTVAASATASTVILGVLAYLLFPRCKEFVWTVVCSDTPRLAASIILALRRAPAEHRELITTLIEPELNAVSRLPEIARAIEATAKAQEKMAITLKEIHDETMEHGKRMERWEGYMEGQWDGKTERRQRTRRKPDGN